MQRTKNCRNRTRRWLLPVALGMVSLMIAPRAAKAEVSTSVSVVGAPPQSVRVGHTFTVTFRADANGKPNEHNECEILGNSLRYAWTITVTGSDGGVATYSGSGSTGSAVHTANNLCQHYDVSATCTISYDTSPECEVPGNTGTTAPGNSGSVVIPVSDTPCETAGTG